jgi:hypothetical protein
MKGESFQPGPLGSWPQDTLTEAPAQHTTTRADEDESIGVVCCASPVESQVAGDPVEKEGRSCHGPEASGSLSLRNDRQVSGEFLNGLSDSDGLTSEIDVTNAKGNGLLPCQPEHACQQHQGLVVAGQLDDESAEIIGAEGPVLGPDDSRERNLARRGTPDEVGIDCRVE